MPLDYTTQLEEEALQAWRELCRIEREQERLSAMRAEALNDLEKSRQRASILEQVTSVHVFCSYKTGLVYSRIRKT